MQKLVFGWKTFMALLLGGLAHYLGGWDTLLQALVILVVLDVVTGFLRAFIQKRLSSDVSFRGIAKKALIFVIVAVAVQVDRITGMEAVARNVVAAFYCASEGLSVVENAVASGMPVPEFLREALKQINEKKFTKSVS